MNPKHCLKLSHRLNLRYRLMASTAALFTSLALAAGLNYSVEEKFLYRGLTQAGGVTYQLRFHVPDARAAAASVPRPSKLIVQIDPKRLIAGYLVAGKVAFMTSTPSFRVNLNCQK